jgi:uncharacterized protein (DUF697 family)
MSVRTTIPDPVPESSTRYVSFTITDIDGVTPLPNADAILTTLIVTLFNKLSKVVINSRTAQSILGVNGGTVTSAGLVTLRLDPADTAILGSAASESRIASFAWTWGSPLQTSRHEVLFTVTNMALVP